MSRKHKKTQLRDVSASPPTSHATGLPSSDATAKPQQQFSLAELQSLARTHMGNKAWTELVAIGRLPDSAICEDDRKEAEVWQLRVMILGLHPSGVLSIYDLSAEARAALKDALERLADRVEALHTLPEFDLYLATRGWSFEDTVQVFRHLVRGCMEVTNADWIRKLRGRALRLLNWDESDEERSDSERELVASLPDIHLVLSEAYAAAESSGNLDEEGQSLVRVLKLELDMVMAEPWDYGHVTDSLLRLPSPSTRELAAVPREDPRGSPYQHLTPKAWAFMWELEHARADSFVDLMERYPDAFACDGCEGLRLVVKSLVSAPHETDEILSTAIKALMRFADDSPEWFGESLTLMLPEGPREIYIGQTALHMESVSHLLVRLIENAPTDYPRSNELGSLYRIFEASSQYSPLEDEDDADENMPGLAWLCEQSISFQFAAAYAVQGVAGRMLLLLDALRRTVEAGVPPPYNYYSGELTGEDIELSKVDKVLDCVSRLVPLRDAMDKGIERMWREVIGDIFSALSRLEGDVRHRTLDLAREFSEDLLEKSESFRLAYLEQVVGDPGNALRYYLINFDTSKELVDAAVKNAKLLWQQSRDLDQVQGFVGDLKEAAKTNGRAEVVRQLLADAQVRLADLNKQAQFEQTAVNRWPTLTAPARKLLGVFAAIQRYSSFRELGEYAGMDEIWAERHYNKLVETGMLLVSDKGFRINPHIAPHLERESQHAVVGRIVRSQGTSAVKQVFNSQREFTIYQVLVQLCPNHLVFPNSSLQSIMSFDRMKELVNDDDFGYYLRASVDIVVVSSTTYLPMLAIEVDSVWHDTERQQKNDGKKDRLFAAAGVPFMRLRPVGSPSENTIRAQVAEHVDELVRTLRADLPGFEQARGLLEDLSGLKATPSAK